MRSALRCALGLPGPPGPIQGLPKLEVGFGKAPIRTRNEVFAL